MHKWKFVLSIASIGLIYYGSQSLYNIFATPAIQSGQHGAAAATGSSVAGGMLMIPAVASLVVGLVLAFGCIFWWASGIGRQPRRYSVPAYAPPVQPMPVTATGRTLADMPVPMGPKAYASGRPGGIGRTASTNVDGRRVHNIARDQGKPAEVPTSTGTATPPPFDPY